MRKKQFTIVELAALLAMLFLALFLAGLFVREAREQARQYNCAGNLKCMGVALLMYSGDFSGHFPPTPAGNSLEPLNSAGYLRDSKVYQCPSSISGRTQAGNSDYWYIGGGLKDDNASAPTVSIAYDMSGNHGGIDNDWMNALFIDGHVGGGVPGRNRLFNNNDARVSP